MTVGQMTGRMTGEFQDGRPAQAPVGDEQRTFGAILGARDIGRSMFDHQALQRMEPVVTDGESEREHCRL